MIRKYAEIFCWKNVSSFCSAKATHIFSSKNIRILYIESPKTVNEMTLNELVKLTTLWTTGPWCFFLIFQKYNWIVWHIPISWYVIFYTCYIITGKLHWLKQFLGLWQFVPGISSSSHWGLIIAQSQKANWDDLGMSFQYSIK